MPGISTQVQKLMSSKAFWNYELQNFLGRLGTPNLSRIKTRYCYGLGRSYPPIRLNSPVKTATGSLITSSLYWRSRRPLLVNSQWNSWAIVGKNCSRHLNIRLCQYFSEPILGISLLLTLTVRNPPPGFHRHLPSLVRKLVLPQAAPIFCQETFQLHCNAHMFCSLSRRSRRGIWEW